MTNQQKFDLAVADFLTAADALDMAHSREGACATLTQAKDIMRKAILRASVIVTVAISVNE